ncbi:MAG: hypothetical protein IPF64_14175 [Flavobacteriales bacterium]|nr:hypothetical protein [Flavobacteriales bacterium]
MQFLHQQFGFQMRPVTGPYEERMATILNHGTSGDGFHKPPDTAASMGFVRAGCIYFVSKDAFGHLCAGLQILTMYWPVRITISFQNTHTSTAWFW